MFPDIYKNSVVYLSDKWKEGIVHSSVGTLEVNFVRTGMSRKPEEHERIVNFKHYYVEVTDVPITQRVLRFQVVGTTTWIEHEYVHERKSDAEAHVIKKRIELASRLKKELRALGNPKKIRHK